MARDWMRDRNDLDRNDRQRLRGDWDRDMSRSFSGDIDRDRWTRDASTERDEDRGFMNRYGTERGYGGSMGGNFDRDRLGDRYTNERGYHVGGFGDFDRDRDRDLGRDRDSWRDEGRQTSGMYGRNLGGGFGHLGGGYDRNVGGYDRTGGAGYGAYGGYSSDRNLMGRGDRFDAGDRFRNRYMGGRERMGGYDRSRDDDRGFFQRVGDWFSDMTGGEDRPRGRGPRNYTRSDDRIRDDVYDRLMDNPWVDSSEVEVRVVNAEVTLTGTVPSRHDKRTIEDIAESVLGVKEVHNQLRRQERTQQMGTTGTTSTTGRTTTDNGPRRDLRT